LLAADAEETAPRKARLQSRDEARGVCITGGLSSEYHDRRVRAPWLPQNRKPRYQITAISIKRSIPSRRGDHPDFLSIQFFFRSRRIRISDMALPFTVAGPRASAQVVTPRSLERMNVNRCRTSGICSTSSAATSKAWVSVSFDWNRT